MFARKDHAKRHQLVHTGQGHHKCTVCGKRFTHLNRLNSHMKDHSAVLPFACTICGERFKGKYQRTIHMKAVHNIQRRAVKLQLKSYKCTICNEVFKGKAILNRHELIHSSSDQPYNCDICLKMFSRRDRHIEHMVYCIYVKYGVTVYGTFPFSDIKQKAYWYLEQKVAETLRDIQNGKLSILQKPLSLKLNREMQPDTVNMESSEIGSDNVSIDLKQPSDVNNNQHLKFHINVGRYECEFCDRRFTHANDMIVHVKFHEGALPYKCQHCSIHFATIMEKGVHSSSHIGAYHCELCYERFKTFPALCDHRSIHLRSYILRTSVGRHDGDPCPATQKIHVANDDVKGFPTASVNLINDTDVDDQIIKAGSNEIQISDDKLLK